MQFGCNVSPGDDFTRFTIQVEQQPSCYRQVPRIVEGNSHGSLLSTNQSFSQVIGAPLYHGTSPTRPASRALCPRVFTQTPSINNDVVMFIYCSNWICAQNINIVVGLCCYWTTKKHNNDAFLIKRTYLVSSNYSENTDMTVTWKSTRPLSTDLTLQSTRRPTHRLNKHYVMCVCVFSYLRLVRIKV